MRKQSALKIGVLVFYRCCWRCDNYGSETCLLFEAESVMIPALVFMASLVVPLTYTVDGIITLRFLRFYFKKGKRKTCSFNEYGVSCILQRLKHTFRKLQR